jgi:hypothetical protein
VRIIDVNREMYLFIGFIGRLVCCNLDFNRSSTVRRADAITAATITINANTMIILKLNRIR